MKRIALLLLFALLLDLVLIQPNHPGAMTPGALRMVPLELPILLLGLLALGPGATPIAALMSFALTAMVLLKLADLASFSALGRGFDPVVDIDLVPAGMRVLAGTAGVPALVLALAVLLILLVALGATLFLGLRLYARTGSRLPRAARAAAGTVAIVFLALAGAEVRTALNGWKGWNPPGAAFTARLAAEHLRDFERSRAALTRFETAAASDPWANRSGVLERLDGRDVTVVFVESYGRAALDNPLYAAALHRTLTDGARGLADAGLQVRSGWITSPVRGGQSWLAHGTLASGLDVADQRRYGAMLQSTRQTLYHLAGKAGYRTVAVEPAIVLPWPEGPEMGFGTILNASALGYAGKPFNWVTMPDQYTLSAFDRLKPADRPVMAEIALISSHAPWTPIARLVPWDKVGDGQVFDDMASKGPTPREVWSDPDEIRRHYGMATDYAVATVLSWAALPRARQPLLVVLGDHQAAGFVSQVGGHNVPVHLIGPPEALALFDDWGWTRGPIPAPDLAPMPMSAFRDRFLDATSTGGQGS